MANCTTEAITITISEPPSFQLVPTSETISCNETAIDLEIQNLTNATDPTISWGGSGTVAEDNLSMEITNAGTYSVTITANGCATSDTVSIEGTSAPVAIIFA